MPRRQRATERLLTSRRVSTKSTVTSLFKSLCLAAHPTVIFDNETCLSAGTVEITGGGYAVGGSGCRSVISWGALAPPERAVVVVSQASGVLVEQLAFQTKWDTLKTGTNVTKLMHLGAGAGTDTVAVDDKRFPPVPKGVVAVYDGIYSGTSDIWNASETVIANLSSSEKVQIVHVDGNLHLKNAAAGSVLVGFLIQGTIRVPNPLNNALCRATDFTVIQSRDLIVGAGIWRAETLCCFQRAAHWSANDGRSGGRLGRVGRGRPVTCHR